MPALNEIASGLAFLISLLSNDETLAGYAPGGFFRAFAPDKTATPFGIVAFMSGIDTLTANAVRLMVNALYQVKIAGPASDMSSIVLAASQMDTVLGGSEGLRNMSVPGGYIHACYRESDLQMDSLVTGQQWTFLGGFYRLQMQTAPS